MTTLQNYINKKKALNKAFSDLRADGFIARQHFACCSSCANAELGDLVEESGNDKVVFYHKQDTQHMVNTGTLHLRYRHWNGNDEQDTEVGNEILNALLAHDLEPEWDGNPRSCIILKGV